MRKVPGTTWNRLGFRGVERVRGKFRAVVGNKAWRSAYFDTPKQAARAYDREARRRYGELGFYNFPRAGERKVRPADPDRCCRGHERSLHTYYRPSGGAAYCRKCNQAAHKKARRR